MMSITERLKRLKRISDNVSLNGAMSTHLRLADLLFLIEQAERVKELEEDLRLSEQEEKRRWRENKRYREAPEFYAREENNYHKINLTIWEYENLSSVVKDSGEKAREVLEDFK